MYSNGVGYNDWLYFKNIMLLLLFQIIIYKIYYFNMVTDYMKFHYRSIQVQQIWWGWLNF